MPDGRAHIHPILLVVISCGFLVLGLWSGRIAQHARGSFNAHLILIHAIDNQLSSYRLRLGHGISSIVRLKVIPEVGRWAVRNRPLNGFRY